DDLRVAPPEGDYIGGLGIVEPATPERELGPAVPGRVATVSVGEGDAVTAGTVLVELESDVERAALASAEADVAVARVEVERVGGRARSQDLEALRRDAEGAESRAQLSEAARSRLEATVASGGVSPDQLDRSRRQAEQDRNAADAAAARLASAEASRPIDVRVAQARLDAAIARRDQARAAVGLRRVVSPIEGEVLEVLVEGGEYVQPGGVEPVVVVGDTRTLKARIDIDERDLARLSEGARVFVTADAYPGRTFEGRIEQVGRRMGRKNVRTDEPTQRIDVKILEVVVDLGDVDDLIVGQRIMAWVEAAPPSDEVAEVR
ncbi:MAG: HlyD family efflux transporter periplasmic adaptor subunit, partial [Myxococcota bacterium]